MADPAKKRARKSRKPSKGPAAADELSASIVVVDVEDAPQYYANHVEISHNIHEFEMLFARIPAKLESEQIQYLKKTRKLEIETLVRIVIPPSLISDMIRVLQTQNEKYQAVVKEKGNKKGGSAK